jgi:predicted MFS family arabinose efflux permease
MRHPLKSSRSFLLIAFGVFALSFNQGIDSSVSNNFFRQELGIGGAQMGYYTAARELVGFLMVAVAAITVSFSVSKVAGVALLLTAVGFSSYSQVNSFTQLLPVAMIGSLGFHTWMQVYVVLGLSLADEGYEGRILGKLSSIGSIGTLLSMAVTFVIVNIIGMRAMFLVSALFMVPAGIGLLSIPRNPRLVRQQGFVMKRRYGLYYLLNFLDGCRAQIAMTFALFTLVDVYHVGVQSITLLLIANAIVSWIAAPIFGSWIDRIGEKPILTLCYSISAPVFLAFAFIPNAVVLAVMYIFYQVFGLGMMARNTYLKKIADPADVAPSLAMGVSMMHVAAVIVPITGSLLWQAFGYQVVFLLGFAFIVLSMAATQFIQVPKLIPATAGSGGE